MTRQVLRTAILLHAVGGGTIAVDGHRPLGTVATMKVLFALPVVALMLFGCKKAQTQQANDEERSAKVNNEDTKPGTSKTLPTLPGEETPKTNSTSPLRPVSKRKSSDTGKSTTPAGTAEANKTTEPPTLPEPGEANATKTTPAAGSGSLVGSWLMKADDQFSCTLTLDAGGKGKIRLEESAEKLDINITWAAKDGRLTLTKKDSKKLSNPDVSEGNYTISGDELELNFADEKHVLTRQP